MENPKRSPGIRQLGGNLKWRVQLVSVMQWIEMCMIQ